MNMLLRAVISGFGFSLGAALFRKVSDRVGLSDDKDKAAKKEPAKDDAAKNDAANPGADTEEAERAEPLLDADRQRPGKATGVTLAAGPLEDLASEGEPEGAA